MPKLTIDGKEIDVPKGTSVIEAAKKLDIHIPFYCYHPGLSIAGNCRMCLVEIEKSPTLQIACHLEAQDGMVVKTNTEKVKETRQHVLEFLLVNHPLDCPVCDQAGECWLQDYYMRYGLYDSRFDENKVKKPKAVSIGPTVMLDAERCILCSRCVRFTDEISKTQELGIVNRGNHSEIQVHPDRELNNPYSGNVVDICPVGALTDKDFRFKCRVWYLKSQDSICNGCSRGCNIQVHYNLGRPHHAQGERVMRLKPRFNEHVNKWWMCDEGRYGYKFHDHNRLTAPLRRVAHGTEEISWQTALVEAAGRLDESKGNFGVFLSPQLSNEEIYLAERFFRVLLGAKHVFLAAPNAEGFQDNWLIRADKNPNTKGAEVLGFQTDEKAVQAFYGAVGQGEVDGIVVFGQDLLTLHGTHLSQEQLGRLKWSVFIGANHNLMSESATFTLPAATYFEKEGTFTNFEGRVQKFNKIFPPLGEARSEREIIVGLAQSLDLHIHYDREEEIFTELASKVKAFDGMTYEKLEHGGADIRLLAAPMIPFLEQASGLIFFQEDSGSP